MRLCGILHPAHVSSLLLAHPGQAPWVGSLNGQRTAHKAGHGGALPQPHPRLPCARVRWDKIPACRQGS